MKVLFVCVHNAGRSQMAEAFFNREAAQRGLTWRAESAGTLGAGSLNPAVVEAMEEVGISLEKHYPKQLDQAMVHRADRIVGMGCGVDAAACPTKFLLADDWGLDDPAGQSLETVRRVRDQIERRVLELFDSVTSHEPAAID